MHVARRFQRLLDAQAPRREPLDGGPAYVARTSQGEATAVEEEQLALGLVADGVLAHPLSRVTA